MLQCFHNKAMNRGGEFFMKPRQMLQMTGGLLAVLLLIHPTVRADEGSQASDPKVMSMVNGMADQMKQMQRTIDAQNSKIRDLENRPTGGGGGAASPTPPMSDYEFGQRLDSALGGAQKWLKDLSFKGDLRLRYEAFQFHSGRTASSTDDRNRFRFRLRFGWEKKFSDDLKIGFGLASGDTLGTNGINADPASTNSTLSQDFTFKNIWIEKAYASYTPSFIKFGPLQKVNFTAGKFDNPFEKGSSDIVWDRDIKPEGIYEKMDFKLLDTENFDLDAYLTLGQLILQESSTIGNDAELFAHQLGLSAAAYMPFMERPVQWLGALSMYQYHNYAEKSNFIVGGTSFAVGNSAALNGDAGSLGVGGFSVWEVYNEVAFTPYGLPIRPYFDALVNTGAEDQFTDRNNGWGLGTKIGGINKKGDWELNYQYKWIEADVVPGRFADSDFGNGGTDKRGSVFKLGYALSDAVTVNGAMYLVNNLSKGTSTVDEEQRRFQMDLVYKF